MMTTQEATDYADKVAAARAMLAALEMAQEALDTLAQDIADVFPARSESATTLAMDCRTAIAAAHAAGITAPTPREVTRLSKVTLSGRDRPIVLADFFDVNADARLDERRILADLQRTGTYTGGGGTEPAWTLTVQS